MQGGDNWKRKLIQSPNTYDGSFNEADMQLFRPVPAPNQFEDPWCATRMPDQTMYGYDRLAMPVSGYQDMSMGPFNQMNPHDELSRIKMRNRRYVNACAQENCFSNGHLYGGAPLNRGYGFAPAPNFDYEIPQDELSMIDQQLNFTRRSTRPFIPTHSSNFVQLQREVQDMEQPLETHRQFIETPTSVEQLPLPRRTGRAPATEAAMAGLETPASKAEFRMADKIAMRSLVLTKTLPRIGGTNPAP